MLPNRSQLVRQTCAWVYSQAQHVKINKDKLFELADKYSAFKDFNEDKFHETSQQSQRALLQLFMLDFMNFCFWPMPNFEYEQLASNIQKAVKEGIDLAQLQEITEQTLVSKVFGGLKVSQSEERVRILRELACTVKHRFGGSFVKIIESANKSAVTLLNILTQNFRNFQDHMIYKGCQVHFYKRAQILIGDIYGRYKGTGLGEFKDIQQLTMYPDYRVPQVLQADGVFEYSEALWNRIKNKEQITDRYQQAEIRASSVVAVQWIKEYLQKNGRKVISIELDWFLWQRGQNNLANLPPHHRCLTIYY